MWHLARWAVVVGLGSASKTSSELSPPKDTLASTESDGLGLCYGYRGNGTSISATLGGIACFMDEFGAPEAVIGTSSGSVATVLTESVMAPIQVDYRWGQARPRPRGRSASPCKRGL